MIFFQKNISLLRTKKSMTLSQITKELGFSVSQWSNYEQGVSFPKFLDLIKISKYFNISESELIHVDIELNDKQKTSIVSIKNEEIIILQNKLIKVQEDKINDLQNEINKLRSNG